MQNSQLLRTAKVASLRDDSLNEGTPLLLATPKHFLPKIYRKHYCEYKNVCETFRVRINLIPEVLTASVIVLVPRWNKITDHIIVSVQSDLAFKRLLRS